MEKKEALQRITRAIADSKFRWRTLRGIAKDSGVPVPQVSELLERSDAFIRARTANKSGQPLYTTKDKHRTETSVGQRVINAIVNDNAE
jgi:hypothetical protein